MKRKTGYSVTFAATTFALFVACTPVRAADIDDKIAASFKQTYVYRTYLKDDAITASVKDGVVILAGTVAQESHKTLAQETALRLPGVTRVENQLTIIPGGAAENSDAWIANKVKLALQFHRNVNATTTYIEVKKGIVTLKGEALSVAQKDLASEYAGDIEGVKEVVNEMTVALTPAPVQTPQTQDDLDDASITAQVMTSLMNHRSTRPVNTRVATRNGEVTLTGIARSEAEKALIAKLAADIQGVVSVKNQMTVDDSTTNK